ncbi:hypothetical protein C2E31_20465 [Rhodopirellula baltica]|nr:hypothetical protein C2E31_20465 [Rhodopirellula baltica]
MRELLCWWHHTEPPRELVLSNLTLNLTVYACRSLGGTLFGTDSQCDASHQNCKHDDPEGAWLVVHE